MKRPPCFVFRNCGRDVVWRTLRTGLWGVTLIGLQALVPVGWAGPSSWDVPEEADLLVNSIPVTQESLGAGSVIYAKRCAICHGDTGEGNGPSSQSLGVRPANFRDVDLMAQSDGSLFWKISMGRGPMPNWQVILSDEERWQVIHYLRVLSSTSSHHTLQERPRP